MRPHLQTLTASAVLWLVALPVSLAETTKPAEAACSELMNAVLPGLVMEAAAVSPSKPPLPRHCRLQGILNPRAASNQERYGMGFELRLPLQWNGRFVFQGGAGLDGVLQPALGDLNGSIAPSALARGFAVVSSDGGHRSTSMIDPRFGLDQQARLDYAFNALDKVTLAAKALVRRFYGRDAQRAYFVGCSNGGRQGMLAAQRYPDYFDGIVAGAPAFRLSRIVVNQIWNVQVLTRIAPKDASGSPILSRAFSDEELKRVADGALAACDARDGLADGMINDWRTCPFDPGTLQCSEGRTDGCLTAAQISALRDMASGARNSRGETLYGRFPFDTGIATPAWRGMRLGRSTTAESDAADVLLGVETLRYYMLTPPEPAFDPLRFDFDRGLARTRQMQVFTDADATYLQSFAEHGKLLIYHGVSDQGMAAGALAEWYEEAVRDNGPRTSDFARLFFVPGMTHCGGGQSTDRFDMLGAIQEWVEQGKAPDRIVATGSAFPGIARPLCPYPQIARYVAGDPSAERSFQCR